MALGHFLRVDPSVCDGGGGRQLAISACSLESFSSDLADPYTSALARQISDRLRGSVFPSAYLRPCSRFGLLEVEFARASLAVSARYRAAVVPLRLG